MDTPTASRLIVARFGVLAGWLYFVQGVCEPTEGLISQPVRSLLSQWNVSAGQIALWMALVALPWSIKPVYGVLIDFVPLGSHGRRGYLILFSFLATLSSFALVFTSANAGNFYLTVAALIVATLSVAAADVVIDAMMIEFGKPIGMTGRLQSIQWSTSYAAMILTGLVGGWLSQNNWFRWAFLASAMMNLASLLVAIAFVPKAKVLQQESAVAERGFQRSQGASRRGEEWRRWFGNRLLIWVAIFLWLWNFNPYSSAVQYSHFRGQLGMSDIQYGSLISLFALSSLAGSILYGFYCRRISFPKLVRASIPLGVASTATYLCIHDFTSAWWVTLLAGASYVTGSLIQMDLVARVCPTEIAATVFATMMAISNLSIQVSTALGGMVYDSLRASFATETCFAVLVVLGAVSTLMSVCCIEPIERAMRTLEIETASEGGKP